MGSVYLAGKSWTITRQVERGSLLPAVKAPVRLRTDRFGVATMHIEVQTRADRVELYLPQPGDMDPFTRQLRFATGTLDIAYGENGRAIIAADFCGIFRNSIRNARPILPQRSAGFTERQVTITNGSFTLTLTYIGPRATYHYATLGDPKAAAFAGELIPTIYDFQITEIRGPNDEDLSGEVTLEQLTDAGYQFAYTTKTTTFNRDEDTAGVWRITEENEGLIIATMPGA